MNFKSLIVASAILFAGLASEAMARDTVRLCTGGAGGPYAIAGQMIADIAENDPAVEVVVVTDTGGTWGNIQRTVTGPGCDAMIGQPDGHVLLKSQNPAMAAKLKPVGDLHREYLHALCGKDSGVDDIGDLESDPVGNGYSIALGDTGSGAWLIWQNFVAEDADYGKVPTKAESGDIALASVASGETTCALFPAALGNATVKAGDELYGDGLALVGVNDADFNDATDPQGKPLYQWAAIPSGTYKKNLQGWFSSKDTITWKAKVYVNVDRVTGPALPAFIRATMQAKPSIVANFGG